MYPLPSAISVFVPPPLKKAYGERESRHKRVYSAFLQKSVLTSFLPHIAIVISFFWGYAGAAEFSIGPHGFGVSIEGEIKLGDFKRFRNFIVANNKTQPKLNSYDVFINSPGGSVEEALAFAKAFSEDLSHTWVMQGDRCFSACTIIWAGGAGRTLYGDAKLGFHRLSFTGKDVDVKKTKARTDSGSNKVTAFFREVGFPTLLIEKMNETPPSDIYVVDNNWLYEHELERAVAYQPAFLDVVEKQCGVDPSAVLLKKGARRLAPSEKDAWRDSHKKWLSCADEVKEANRQLAFDAVVRSKDEETKDNLRLQSMVAHTQWRLVFESAGGASIYIEKNTAKRTGRVVRLWMIANFGSTDGSFLQYTIIDCNAGTVASTQTSYCDGHMCKTVTWTSYKPEIAEKVKPDSLNSSLFNAACNGK